MEDEHQCHIHVIKPEYLWFIEQDSMHPPYRCHPPRDVSIDEEWREEEYAADMMDEECFLTEGVDTILRVLH